MIYYDDYNFDYDFIFIFTSLESLYSVIFSLKNLNQYLIIIKA
jgi:hypothetical protein